MGDSGNFWKWSLLAENSRFPTRKREILFFLTLGRLDLCFICFDVFLHLFMSYIELKFIKFLFQNLYSKASFLNYLYVYTVYIDEYSKKKLNAWEYREKPVFRHFQTLFWQIYYKIHFIAYILQKWYIGLIF